MVQRLSLFLLVLLFCMNGAAQEEIPAVALTDTEQVSPGSASPVFSPANMVLNVYAGNFAADDDPQFVNVNNQYALGIGISADISQYPHLAVDLDLFYINRDYDTRIASPLWGSIEDETSIETTAVLLGGRAFYPVDGPWRLYGTAGLGYFYTRMVVYGNLLGVPGSYDDDDKSLALYYGAGGSYRFGSWGLSLDYRHIDLDGSFSKFDVHNANLGGDMLLLGWHYYY